MALAEYTSTWARDFRQRYEGTYGWSTNDEGQETIVAINGVNSERCYFVDENETTYYARPDQGIKFKFIPVDRKVFMHNNNVCTATRIPARQWQRGICASNTAFVRILNRRTFDVNFQTLLSYLAPTERITSLYSVGCIDNKFAIPGNKTLYIYDKPIGKISSEDTVVLDDYMFLQELLDAFRDNNYPFKVLVNEH